MIKKIVLGIIFIGLIAFLVIGGINRTLALTQEESTTAGTGRGSGNGIEASEHDELLSLQSQTEDGISYQEHQENTSQSSGRGNSSRGSGQQTLDASEIETLHLALDDEYKALATYVKVIETLGQVAPFAQIVESEQSHIDALINQFNKYGLSIPENPWYENVPVFDSLEAACAASAQAEIDNATLCEQLTSMTENADLIRVFNNLGRASRENHLPEFQDCQ